MAAATRGSAPMDASSPSLPRRVPALAEAFDPRRNSLAMLRLALATIVLLAHALSIKTGDQPALGRTPVADFAVDGFFVLSGFLVTRSYGNLASAGRYAWHRLLRLMPGFWVCLIVTAVVLAPIAAMLVGRPPASVFTADTEPAWRYPLVNSGLALFQFGIADIRTPLGGKTVDGALWTLVYEATCYAVVGALGVAGLAVRRRGAPLVLLVVAVWIGALLDAAGLIPVDVPVLENQSLLRFLLVFLLGAVAWVYADRVPVTGAWAAVALIAVVGAAFLPDYRVVAAVPFAYLCLWATVRLPLWWNPAWDLSYGIYIYHYPVQFLLVLTVAAQWSDPLFVLVSLALTVPLAALSWVFVEGPALRLKGMPAPGRRLRARRRFTGGAQPNEQSPARDRTGPSRVGQE